MSQFSERLLGRGKVDRGNSGARFGDVFRPKQPFPGLNLAREELVGSLREASVPDSGLGKAFLAENGSGSGGAVPRNGLELLIAKNWGRREKLAASSDFRSMNVAERETFLSSPDNSPLLDLVKLPPNVEDENFWHGIIHNVARRLESHQGLDGSREEEEFKSKAQNAYFFLSFALLCV